jgi:hypothetical protein
VANNLVDCLFIGEVVRRLFVASFQGFPTYCREKIGRGGDITGPQAPESQFLAEKSKRILTLISADCLIFICFSASCVKKNKSAKFVAEKQKWKFEGG